MCSTSNDDGTWGHQQIHRATSDLDLGKIKQISNSGNFSGVLFFVS